MECLLFHKQIHVKYMLTCVRWQLMKNVERVLFYYTFKMILEVDGTQNMLHTMFPFKDKLKRITN